VGGARAELTGAVEWASDHYLFDVRATLPPMPCQTAMGAIPSDLLAEVSGFSWSGNMGGFLRAQIDSRNLRDTELELRVADGCAFVNVPVMADLRRVEGPFTHRVLEPDGTYFEMTTGPGSGNWTSIHTISPFFLHAVLAHEDASFFAHHGFAPWAIRGALVRNLEARRYVQGASTITMQLAKNLFLHREKTLARKVQEALLTWWLETALDKRAILELYVNIIEYGPGIYGITEAARHYFGRHPSELSPVESAFLANILPNPPAYHGQYERGHLSESMTNRVRAFLQHMFNRERIDQAALDYGFAELATFRFHRGSDGPPTARGITGAATPLPFESFVPPDDAWSTDEGWDEWGESLETESP